MTSQRRFKQKVRARMERTGERYAAARGVLIGEGSAAGPEQDVESDTQPEPATQLDESLFEMAGERVLAATGKGRAEWFALLDATDAHRMAHGDIVRALARLGLEGWWAQTVAVDYERARGLRARYQRSDGFSISKSRTVAVPVAEVYAAWVDTAARRTWLDGELEVTATQEHKSVRGRWEGGPTRVVLTLVVKGEAKTQAVVTHEKLPDAEAAERAKEAWAGRLDRLVEFLARG